MPDVIFSLFKARQLMENTPIPLQGSFMQDGIHYEYDLEKLPCFGPKVWRSKSN